MATNLKPQLIEYLEEQLGFIQKSISEFQNSELEAKRVATNVRTLVHDTHNSTSLLMQLNAKNIGFIDTNAPKGGMAYWYLSGVEMSNGNYNQNTPYVGIVGKELIGQQSGISIKYFPIYQRWTNGFAKINFDNWWNTEIYDNRKGYTLTRKKLILNVVNKDGGAHIDEPDLEYDAFKNEELIKFNVNGSLQGFDNIPVFSAVMQIAWELLNSIQDELDNIKK